LLRVGVPVVGVLVFGALVGRLSAAGAEAPPAVHAAASAKSNPASMPKTRRLMTGS
jgi:hypothetical protein